MKRFKKIIFGCGNMVFGFLKKNKKENEVKSSSISSSGGSFWEKCVVTGSLEEYGFSDTKAGKSFIIPFEDIRVNAIDQSFLMNILKNDTNLHRRTAAFFVIMTVHKPNEDFDVLCYTLMSELNISEDDFDKILDDFMELLQAKGNGANIVLGV